MLSHQNQAVPCHEWWGTSVRHIETGLAIEKRTYFVRKTSRNQMLTCKVPFVSKLRLRNSGTAAKTDAEDADCGSVNHLLVLGNEKNVFRLISARKCSLKFSRMGRCCSNAVFFCVFCGYSIKHGRDIYFRNFALEIDVRTNPRFVSIRSSWLRLLVGYFRCKKFLDDDNWFWLVVQCGVCQAGSARPECFAVINSLTLRKTRRNFFKFGREMYCMLVGRLLHT